MTVGLATESTACVRLLILRTAATQNRSSQTNQEIKMKKLTLLLALLTATAAPIFAQEGSVPKGIPHLDHVFLIMMENHGYTEILHNPNAKFVNGYAKSGNLATNYFAVAHPSLTNYLEVVGGSNFGVLSDNAPDWHSATCATNLSNGSVNTDSPPSPAICPVWGSGTDAATPVLDCTNEVTGDR